jgi:threonine dehydrogenase-like Zn-dependent dehydrogenase
MRAAVFHGNSVLAVEDCPEPRLEAPDDVLLEVEACGICGTDLQITSSPPGHPAEPPVILGHEFVGRVAAVGSAVREVAEGDRVVVDTDPKCGRCHYCRSGRPAYCINTKAIGIFRDGGLARFVLAPEGSVYRIADHVPAPLAALVEPLACVINGANKVAARPGESVLVLGGGTIGCLFTAVLKASGAAPVVVVEPRAERQSVPRAVGADHVWTPDELATRREELLPLGADIVIDAVGSQFATAIEHAAMGARIVLFGQNSNALPAIRQNSITVKSLNVFGSYISNFTYPAAIRLVEQGRLPLEPIVSRVMPLEQTLEAFDLLRSGVATKVTITP